MIDLGLVFVTGLLSSLHCIGMCGPIVLAYATVGAQGDNAVKNGMFKLHAAYNTGRISSYAVLGALVGLAGTALGSLKVLSEYISVIGGALMVIFGLTMLGFLIFPKKNGSGIFSGVVRKLYGSLLKKRTWSSKMSLGALTPLLPCGILYAMLIKAMTAGTATGGAMTMAVFGFGMAPSLILMGSLSSILSTRMRKGAEQIAAIAVILMGIILILRGFHIPYLSWFMGGGASGSEGGCCL